MAVADGVLHGIPVRASGQRGGTVQHATGVSDYFFAAFRVEAGAFFRAVLFGDGIGAIQRVIQAAPAGVGRVQGVAGVAHRHHQLRACLRGDFAVNIGRGGFHAIWRVYQVTHFFQEAAVGGHVADRAGVFTVPSVQLFLQRVALFEQLAVFRGQIVKQSIDTGPEGAFVDAGARQSLLVDETI